MSKHIKQKEKMTLLFFLPQDYHIGVGITSIEMNVGNVKDSDRRNFDLTTPYRIFRYRTHTARDASATVYVHK